MAKRILVVDDEQKIVDLLSRFLSKEGFSVLTATDGRIALDILQSSLVELIILDIMMPGMDGGDVLANIRKDERLKNIPVIFLSGAVTDDESLARDKKSNAPYYMSKAGNIEEHVKFIKGVLAR